ncbi:SDR family NAD(P)-dependent oxidoreductase [Bosea sp. BIWAKO-01]|uniref:SDR family NAD(P)-dependent oxidoreductase n=1 Tax=Bosea sp. BIWAKO-01 TaxID=506668 RepID=UPI00114C8D9E|nr:SDR family oxidoreductase [Bosea sp. BIWAKO-01]
METRHITRRLAIAGSGLGMAVGAAAGLAGGAMLGAAAAAPAPVVLDGRRRFENKVVLVTGGTSGIGRAAAEAFAAEGGKVAFCGRREALGQEVERGIRAAGGEAFYIRADIRREDDVRRFVESAVTRYGGLHVAFNNAGITLQKPLHSYEVAEFDDILSTNLRGVFLAMKYQIPHMMSAGGQIVVTSSTVATTCRESQSAYVASKAALTGLVRAAALDYVKHGIRVNALLPGTTDTELVRGVAGMMAAPDAVWQIGGAQWAKDNIPTIGRMATAREMAAVALDLAAATHPYLTGASIVVDGAMTLRA